MSFFRTLTITMLFVLFVTACGPYREKKVVGDPGAFSSSSDTNLLPSLDLKCEGANCITR